jgi:uncharacterized membrane protein YcaP (DUF421 family)
VDFYHLKYFIMDLHRILLEGTGWELAQEILLRTVIMFSLILLVLRLSGRRGVRQLTLFEVAIILGLGSAAGDPMFQPDIPLVNAALVMLTVIVFYKLVTISASHWPWLTHLLEGRELIVVQEGKFALKDSSTLDFSQNEFLAELRNQSIEHLGQVRQAVLEIDGTLSVLKYSPEEIRWGLPLFPLAFVAIQDLAQEGPLACMHCGEIISSINDLHQKCPRCHKSKWAKASQNPYWS